MSKFRMETDSFGAIEVPGGALWGAQTARSLIFFAIGDQRMPLEIIHAIAWIKWAAAEANLALGLIGAKKALAITEAAQKISLGVYDAEFPLSVWQTGSGTHKYECQRGYCKFGASSSS